MTRTEIIRHLVKYNGDCYKEITPCISCAECPLRKGTSWCGVQNNTAIKQQALSIALAEGIDVFDILL